MGAAGLVRVEALHDPTTSGARVKSLYEQVLERSGDSAANNTTHRLSPERAALAVEYLPLARQLAGWYTGRGQSQEDLVQVASLGLVRAAERFNPDFGREFHSFAMPTILGELRRHFRDQAWAVRVPRGLQENTLAVQRASEELRQELGHDASTADLAQELGLVEEEIRAALQAQGEARTSRSLDHPTGDDESRTFGDLVGGPDPALELVEQSHDVRAALAKMPPRELEIVLMRFYGDHTQSEIAERLGMSQVHVSRVLTRTLAAVRDHVLYDIPLPSSWERSAGQPAAEPVPEDAIEASTG
jgi:RNA polymerase sigma-B factor